MLFFLACTEPDPVDTDTTDTDTTDTGRTDSDTDTDTDTTPDACAAAGLTARPWVEGTDGDFDTVAPDFTVETTTGPWTFSEAFTGCDVIVSVVYDPDLSLVYPDFSTGSSVRGWLEASPPNVHYLIWVDAAREPDRETTLATIQEQIDQSMERVDEAVAAQWEGRIHYVIDNPNFSDTNPWIGDLADYRTGVPINWVIDRFQVVREMGYLSDSNTGWEETPAEFLNYEVEWYNHQSDLQDALDADGATVLRAFDVSAERVVTLDLPDASTMATFDTFELDMSFICNGHPDATGCGEWDYLAYAYICNNDDPATTDVDESNTCTEIGRFITAYARPGRWVVDATPFLAMLADGGAHTFRVNSANAPYITLDLRFSNQGKGYRPVAMEYLWSGGQWDENYNVDRDPIAFTAPTGASRAEIWTLISGHGFGADRENCAEFCNHQHQFTVNDSLSVMQEFTIAGTSYGCAEQVGSGTVPNQYGTWVLGRGGWCPGRQVDPWSADISAAVDFSGENTLTYLGLFEGETYVPQWIEGGSGFAGRADVASWLVFYE